MAHDRFGALAAKAKALYGNRLKPADYETLVRINTVQAAVDYLTTHTAYAEVLQAWQPGMVRRGLFENQIRTAVWLRMSRLLHLTARAGDPVFFLFIHRLDISRCLQSLGLLNGGAAEVTLPDAAELPVARIRQVTGLEDLQAAYAKVPFIREALTSPPRTTEGRFDLLACENRLMTAYDRQIARARGMPPLLRRLFDAQADAANLMTAYRLKKNHDLPPGNILPLLTTQTGRLTKTLWQRILETPPDALPALMRTTVYARFFQSQDLAADARRMVVELARHTYYQTMESRCVFCSYHVLLQNEADNLIRIVEGLRYGWNAEAIRETLLLI